jgi:hypothetical protein
MPGAAIATLVIAGLIIAFTAVALLRVIFHLRATYATLGNVLGGVTVIADQTSTVPARLVSVNEHLKPVSDFCESV